MLFFKKKQKILKGENRAFLPFLPRSKDDDDVNDDRRRKAFSATSLSISLPHLFKAKETTDSFLARERERKKVKNTAKSSPFQQQKKTKKLEITWTVFRYPGGQGYLFRFRPDFVAFTRGRALSRGGRFLF